MAVALLTQRAAIVRVATVLCAAVLAPLLADAVRQADHWPSDDLADLLIAGARVART
ncbi:MAG: hypothetical protein IT196_03005 [Acidimicrobiales bacterium]|nr:hypothetical protein [Acidimicrobiales bacterium]